MALLALAALGAAIVARAAVPQQIGYQGSLVDSANQPVNASITMTFRLYNVASGGSALYTESQSVAVTAGQFNAAIGAITPLTLPFDVPYYIGVTVGGDAEMTPRQALAAAPYALRTAAADSVAAAAALPAVQITGTIGTTQIANAAVTAAKLSANYAGSASAGGPATTAVALAANGTNCPPGQLAAGVDAQGNAEGCSTPPAGTVTSVTAGTGLTGGTITATGTIAADATYLQRRVAASCAPGSYIRAIAADGTVTCGTDANSGGTVTSITAGGGLTGGTITGSGTIAVDAASPLLTTNFYKLGGNAFVADPAVLGTTSNSGLNLIVNGTPALQMQPANSTDPGTPSAPNLIGGSVANAVLGGVFGATIGGGGQIGTAVGILDCGLTCGNNVLDAFGTIGGGAGNLVGDGLGTIQDRAFGTVGGGLRNAAKALYATVGGGYGNTVSGASSVIAGGFTNEITGSTSFIGGGTLNAISVGNHAVVNGGQENATLGSWSVIGGGFKNSASFMATAAGGSDNKALGDYAAVGGGASNHASGNASTVPGGTLNLAAGDNSFAAGKRGKANHHRSFAWGGGDTVETLTDADGDFVVYAPTHVRMYAGVVGSGGCVLSSGAGWSCSSDRHLKSGIASIDPRAVLDRVLGMPIARWSFTNMPGITHMGPMAQDFRAAFGLGIDDKSINTVDAAGVALAAIQGLHQLLGERDARLREQAREVGRLRKIARALEARAAEVDGLRRKLAAIEAKLGLK